ncbi:MULTISPECIES: sigma-70 family RNA polymerase sigma factor [Actinokineospora]|uniref:DNA-directed RNA polymerase sigma-70 factor n=1 Tax=Actinokineospora fastidiosa TaxID=1816 RepID=A0A918GGY1_9PSEU|nr:MULTISPECIES: sigma-70 family RNA polymerase sigma factor [Actinokineospora]UVS80782.1 putative RNA polymerase sigma factor FecI [Actinokineospora sp. UTMC 2448]GGS37141.1 DNA-directed RNA polymerase sigma-70 factor [Actinokineospora fastidiosa]
MDATQFEQYRPHLRSVAHRMLGSLAEADDAVQETWLRVSRSDTEVHNLGGWLTTVVARVALNMLRARKREVYVPDPVVAPADGPQPEESALMADSVSIALLVVLETLTPAERLAFVLHDLFAVPFDEIAPIVDKSPAATRQLASRARRRVQGAPVPETPVAEQRAVVDAFLAASRGGDLAALVAVLHPDVVIRADGGEHGPTSVLRGVDAVSRGAVAFARLAMHTVPALVNGGAGAVALADGKVFSVASFTVADGRITAMDILTDPDRLALLDLEVLG